MPFIVHTYWNDLPFGEHMIFTFCTPLPAGRGGPSELEEMQNGAFGPLNSPIWVKHILQVILLTMPIW